MRTAEENLLAQIAYDTAYVVLPRAARENADQVRAEFKRSPDLGALLYLAQATKARGAELQSAYLRRVRGHLGRFDGDRSYVVIEFPKVRAFDLTTAFRGDVPPWVASHVLAPYFAAMVDDRANRFVRCFVLGQSPDAETTLRAVSTRENLNLGSGCEPKLEEFLQLIDRRTR